MKKRVVITGYSMITPLANTAEESFEKMIKGESGITKITKFDATDFTTKIAGEIKDFNPEDYMNFKTAKITDTFTQYAIATSKMALEKSKLEINDKNSDKIGVIMGSSIGGVETYEKYHKTLLEKGPRKITPFFIPMILINIAAGQISIMFGIKGPSGALVTACASGNSSIGEAYRIIQREECVAMIAGGTDAVISPMCVAGFNAMRVLSTQNDSPETASKPFDKKRDGFILSEGAGTLVLEELEHALKRNATIYAEIMGYGVATDAYHISTPEPESYGMYTAMKNALAENNIKPVEIQHINAHGTSSYYNDIHETKAIKKLFGEYSKKIKINAIKSMTGHALGAASAIEAVTTIMTIHNNIIPPTINLNEPDPECDLNYTPNKAIEQKIEYALSNSFGFGGINTSLLLKKWAKPNKLTKRM